METAKAKIGCGRRDAHPLHFLDFEPGRGYVDCAGTQPPVEVVHHETRIEARVGGQDQLTEVTMWLDPADQWRTVGNDSLQAHEKRPYALGAIATATAGQTSAPYSA